MAPRGGNVTDLSDIARPGMLARAKAAFGYLMSGSAPDGWMSPLKPLQPVAPSGTQARIWDYPVGYNTRLRPQRDSTGGVTFQQLRLLSRNSDIVRLAIETRKDQMEALDWQILARDDKKTKPDDPRIAQIQTFLLSPDREHDWSGWLRAMLEDLFVLDAVSIYKRRDRRGRLYSLDLLDGSTITLKVDATGRRPLPPDTAYQQCYSDDTEILTRRGWVKFSEASINDEFATRNQNSKKFEWQKSSDIIKIPYRGPMYRFASQNLDILVSPNHRMLINRRPHSLGGSYKNGGESIVTAEELAKHRTTCTGIPVTSEWFGEEIPEQSFPEINPLEYRSAYDDYARTLRSDGLSYTKIADKLGISAMSAYRACTEYVVRDRLEQPKDCLQLRISGDDFAAFMGAYLSEGSCNLTAGRTVAISQKRNGKAWEEYNELLERIAPGRVKYVGDSFLINSTCMVEYLKQFNHARGKWIPDVIMNAPRGQLEIFWHYFRLGDGAARQNKMFTSSRRMAGQLQEIAQKIGWVASIQVRAAGQSQIVEGNTVRVITRGESYVVSARDVGPYAKLQTVEKKSYAGHIWCVSVPNSIVFVRRNGKAAWCGNCIKGVPAVDFTSEELIYAARNVRTDSPYGYSQVEQIKHTIDIAIKRAERQLGHYVDGNINDGVFWLPPEWTADQCKDFTAWWDSLHGGNQGERRKAKFLPGQKDGFQAIAEPPLKDEFDEWIARVVCYAFSLPPTPFVKQMNRATAETAHDAALEEGLAPIQKWVKSLIDRILVTEFDAPDLEFSWIDDREIDPKVRAEIDDIRLRNGSMMIDEVRAANGEDPYPDGLGARPGIITMNGFLPLPTVEQTDAQAEAAIAGAQASTEGAENAQQGGGEEGDQDDKPDETDEEKPGKAVKKKSWPMYP
jgi:hypothetical protein